MRKCMAVVILILLITLIYFITPNPKNDGYATAILSGSYQLAYL